MMLANTPQTYSAEFLENGKAFVVLSGLRRLTGEFELFGLTESVIAKYNARLINPDSVKPAPAPMLKGSLYLATGQE